MSVKDSFIEVDLKVSSEEEEDPVHPQIQSDDHLYWSLLGQCLGLGSDFFQKKRRGTLSNLLIKEGYDRIAVE